MSIYTCPKCFLNQKYEEGSCENCGNEKFIKVDSLDEACWSPLLDSDMIRCKYLKTVNSGSSALVCTVYRKVMSEKHVNGAHTIPKYAKCKGRKLESERK